jgi:hypothetical protein
MFRIAVWLMKALRIQIRAAHACCACVPMFSHRYQIDNIFVLLLASEISMEKAFRNTMRKYESSNIDHLSYVHTVATAPCMKKINTYLHFAGNT